MISIGIGSIILISVFLGISQIHRFRQRRFLNQELDVDSNIEDEYESRFGVLESTVVGVSVFDVLYNIGRMDPFTLAGINHLHHSQDFGSLYDLSEYLKDNIVNSDAGTDAWKQMIHKYKAYTGEELGFDILRNDGHSVEIPDSGTNPIYDAIIDGQKYDFAVTDDPSYIHGKLDTKPDDVNIWTNREMAEAFGDNPRVHIDPNLSVQESYHLANDTFEGITELGDYIDDIPVLTLAFSGIRNAISLSKGNKNIGDAVEQTVLDTAGVGFGGYAGTKVGLGIGLALAPVTGGASAVIIPVTTTVIGTIIGIFTGKSITNWFKKRHLRSAIEDLNGESSNFVEIFVENGKSLLSKTTNIQVRQMIQYNFMYDTCQNWFKRTFFPNVMSIFYKSAQKRAHTDHKQSLKYYVELNNKVLDKPPEEGGLILYSQGRDILLDIPLLVDSWEKVDDKVKKVEKEIKRLS